MHTQHVHVPICTLMDHARNVIINFKSLQIYNVYNDYFIMYKNNIIYTVNKIN